MKKLIILSAVAISSLALTGLSHAQVVTSIQFTGTPSDELTPSQAAGLQTEGDFNVVPLFASDSPGTINQNGGSYTGSQNEVITYSVATKGYTYSSAGGLVDNSDNPSNISYSATGGGATGGEGTGLSGNDQELLSDGLATYGVYGGPNVLGNPNSSQTPQPGQDYYGGPVTLTLSNLDPTHAYDFIAYIADSGDLSVMSLSLNGAGTQYFTSTDGGFAAEAPPTTYVSPTSTTNIGLADPNDPGAASAYGSNYVVFSNVTGSSSDTLALTLLGSYPEGTFTAAGTPAADNDEFGNTIVGLAGVQIVDEGVVPEPSTWALMLGGLGALVLVQRRRKFMV